MTLMVKHTLIPVSVFPTLPVMKILTTMIGACILAHKCQLARLCRLALIMGLHAAVTVLLALQALHKKQCSHASPIVTLVPYQGCLSGLVVHAVDGAYVGVFHPPVTVF